MEETVTTARSEAADIETVTKNPVMWIGYIMVALSAMVFMMPEYTTYKPESLFGFFFFHYVLTIIYFIYIVGRGIGKHKWRFTRESVVGYTPFLVLFFISAFALNREIPVFQQSAAWLSVFLVIQCCALLSFFFFEKLPTFIQGLIFFILGSGLVLHIYFAIFLTPLYAVSIIGFFFLGIPLHALVPLLILIGVIQLIRRYAVNSRPMLLATLAGVIFSVGITVYHTWQWTRVADIVNTEYNRSLSAEDDLPAWARISQRLPRNSFSEKVLKSEVLFTVANRGGPVFWEMPSRSFGEEKKHDPFVVFASMFTDRTELTEEERIKILRALYDSRHQAQERLWSGENLRVTQVNTNVRLWPEHRMAYTEKIVSIANTSYRNSWRNTEEAIFTFHLPEGGVVTSLSLWINGKEEKGYLSSKQKADSAYSTIVGVENRDPSLVHWHEGNTVSVRVFPVTPEENRRVKIGFTSPLKLHEGRLVYENIYFDGPLFNGADEVRTINTGGRKLVDDGGMESAGGGGYEYDGGYVQEWSVAVRTVPLARTAFSFAGESFQVEEYKEKTGAATFNAVYLDINQNWTRDYVYEIMEAAKGKPVYAWDGDLVKLEKDNYKEVFGRLGDLNFTVFPLYAIEDKKSALLVTKGCSMSPNLSELNNSIFYTRMVEPGKDTVPVRTVLLDSGELSPYLKTLKEFRLIHCREGNMGAVSEFLQKGIFPVSQENENQLHIDPAGILVRKTDSLTYKSSAPDHLYRLFAYNNILKNAGARSIQKQFTDSGLVAQAELAYVVSPVSSLVVLETQNDYERFDIKGNENSLGNASMKSSGAVPEPHEWALIALIFLTALYLYREKLRRLWYGIA